MLRVKTKLHCLQLLLHMTLGKLVRTRMTQVISIA